MSIHAVALAAMLPINLVKTFTRLLMIKITEEKLLAFEAFLNKQSGHDNKQSFEVFANSQTDIMEMVMNTKDWIYKPNDGIGVYQTPSLGEENKNPATLEEISPSDSSVQLIIDAEQFDKIAIEWCKHRKLQGALGGPVGKEYGGPDCEYT